MVEYLNVNGVSIYTDNKSCVVAVVGDCYCFLLPKVIEGIDSVIHDKLHKYHHHHATIPVVLLVTDIVGMPISATNRHNYHVIQSDDTSSNFCVELVEQIASGSIKLHKNDINDKFTPIIKRS